MSGYGHITARPRAAAVALAVLGLVSGAGGPPRGAAGADEPGDAVVRAAGLLDSGRYDEAEAALGGPDGPGRTPEAATVRARLAWLKGDLGLAESLLREALAGQKTRTESALEVAPYHVRLGRLLFDCGRVDEAEAEFKAAQKVIDAEHARLHQLDIPHDEAAYSSPETTAGLARVYAARGDAKKAERAWKQVLARSPGPGAIAAAGDFYASVGKRREAESAYRRAEKAASADPGYRRESARFFVDLGRNLDEALAIARDEAARRRDVETCDLLAWALFKKGSYAEAAEAIEGALRLGSKDARIRYHAGMIHARLGDGERARAELGRALALNPYFHPLEVASARKALAELSGGPAETGPGRRGAP